MLLFQSLESKILKIIRKKEKIKDVFDKFENTCNEQYINYLTKNEQEDKWNDLPISTPPYNICSKQNLGLFRKS